jgi:hypothetical protein
MPICPEKPEREVFVRAATLLIVLTVSGMVANASVTISIDALQNGTPIVSTESLIDPVVDDGFESAFITGIISPANTIGPIYIASQSVILDEASSGGSGLVPIDFVTLAGDEITTNCPAGGICQPLSLQFEADGAPTFAADLAALPPGTPRLPVITGTFQDLTLALDSGYGTVAVSVASPITTPEPASLLLVSVAFLFLSWKAARWSSRKRREASVRQ